MDDLYGQDATIMDMATLGGSQLRHPIHAPPSWNRTTVGHHVALLRLAAPWAPMAADNNIQHTLMAGNNNSLQDPGIFRCFFRAPELVGYVPQQRQYRTRCLLLHCRT